MQIVFVLQHVHVLPGGDEDVKFIGVYSSSEAAQSAIERLCLQPGFRDFPRLIGSATDNEEQGFFLDTYRLDVDNWTEGYVTV